MTTYVLFSDMQHQIDKGDGKRVHRHAFENGWNVAIYFAQGSPNFYHIHAHGPEDEPQDAIIVQSLAACNMKLREIAEFGTNTTEAENVWWNR